MSKFQNKMASDALATLDRLATIEPDLPLVDDVAALCKRASIDGDCTKYLVKFAREFAQLSGLCTEDLVKRALQRFLKGRNTDSILRGVKRASDDETIWARSALVLLDGQEIPVAEDAALVAGLEKRASWLKAVIPGAGKLIAGGAKGLWGGLKPMLSEGGRAAAGGASRAGGAARAAAGGASRAGGAGQAGRWASLGRTRALQTAPQTAGHGARNLGMLGLAGGAGYLGGRSRGSTDQDMQMAEMNAIMPYIAQSRDPSQILQYVQQLAEMGQEVSPEVWDALRFGLRYQTNPMMRYNPWAR